MKIVPKRSLLPLLLTLPYANQAKASDEPEAERECLIQASFAHEADRNFASAMAIETMDESFKLAPTMHIRCSRLEEIARFAEQYEVIDDDMQATFRAERERMNAWNSRYSVRATAPENRFKEYLNLEQLRAVVDDWAKEFPKYTEIEEIGKSVKGRPIRAVHISRYKGEKAPKHRMIILGGHHSREWLAHATTMCFAERFLRGIDDESSPYHKLAANMVLSVIPMGNPDGFVMTHGGDRMNRKNANAVDLNRNWDIAWGTGSEKSAGKGAQNYPGTGPWSEPETAAYRDFITKYSDGLKGFIDIHAFIPAIMSPYGYKRGQHPKASEYKKLLDKMSAAMTGPGMKRYKTGPIHQVVYPASGSSSDWVDDKFGAFSFGTEVRGRSFAEPASQIKPSCDENEAAILALLGEIIPLDNDPGSDPGGDETGDPSGDSGDSGDSSDDSGETEKDSSETGEESDSGGGKKSTKSNKSNKSKKGDETETETGKGKGNDSDKGSSDDSIKGDSAKNDKNGKDKNEEGGCTLARSPQPAMGGLFVSLLFGLGLRRRNNA